MKRIHFALAALALLFLTPVCLRAQDDEFPELPDHGVALQQVIKEWHGKGLYTAGWDKNPTIRNYFVGLAHAYPNDLFQMIENKMLGLDVDDGLWKYELDVQNGYVTGELGTETSPSVQMCYWRCNDGSRLIGVALMGYEYNMEEPDPSWSEEEADENIFVNLTDLAFFRIKGDEAIWRPVSARQVCGRDIDFRHYDAIELPRQGKDIRLTYGNEDFTETVTVLKWNGNGFTVSR